uniref:Uncharacterized protein n=1 Tax=Oncorhynchus kisutch TaxID=8019 RepID=A0A8C7EYU0_ONCKI
MVLWVTIDLFLPPFIPKTQLCVCHYGFVLIFYVVLSMFLCTFCCVHVCLCACVFACMCVCVHVKVSLISPSQRTAPGAMTPAWIGASLAGRGEGEGGQDEIWHCLWGFLGTPNLPLSLAHGLADVGRNYRTPWPLVLTVSLFDLLHVGQIFFSY